MLRRSLLHSEAVCYRTLLRMVRTYVDLDVSRPGGQAPLSGMRRGTPSGFCNGCLGLGFLCCCGCLGSRRSTSSRLLGCLRRFGENTGVPPGPPAHSATCAEPALVRGVAAWGIPDGHATGSALWFASAIWPSSFLLAGQYGDVGISLRRGFGVGQCHGDQH